MGRGRKNWTWSAPPNPLRPVRNEAGERSLCPQHLALPTCGAAASQLGTGGEPRAQRNADTRLMRPLCGALAPTLHQGPLVGLLREMGLRPDQVWKLE